MDVLTIILSIGSATVAAVVAVIVGRRRGIDEVDKRADDELARLVTAQSARLALMDTENRELRSRVAALEAEVARMRDELALERRITARLAGASQ
jgi:hypothetical protein